MMRIKRAGRNSAVAAAAIGCLSFVGPLSSVAFGAAPQGAIINPSAYGGSLGAQTLTEGTLAIDTTGITPTITYTGSGVDAGLSFSLNGFTERSQAGGSSFAVFNFDAFSITAPTVVVTVTGDKGLVLASKSDLSFNTALSVNGGSGVTSTTVGGAGVAGGGNGGAGNGHPAGNGSGAGGGAIRIGAASFTAGGGGGAFGGVGGHGGASNTDTVAFGSPGAAGSAYGDQQLSELFGGSGGGRGLRSATVTASGGGGAGAISLVAEGTLNLGTSSSLSAAGGTGGNSNNTDGGGGGSGGSILLAADSINYAGTLNAAGGNGGTGPTGAQSRAGGGGSGGRIALYARSLVGDPASASTLTGGIGPQPVPPATAPVLPENGAVGTFFLNGSTPAFFNAASFYWDTNGTAAGGGGASPSGNWNGSTANFNSDAAGGAAGTTTAATTSANDVVFAAGSDGGGSYTVNVTGTQAAAVVAVARGNVTINGGTLDTSFFNIGAGATGTVSSSVTGGTSSTVTKTGAGTLVLTGANSYTGGATVLAGVLQGTTDGLQGNITNYSSVVFDQATTGTYAGTISGSGSVTKSNTGTVSFTGTNTYTGTTAINAGTLIVSKPTSLPGNATAGKVSVASGATLAVLAGPDNWVDGSISDVYANASLPAGSNFAIDTSLGDFTYGFLMYQANGFIKLGANSLTLPSANVYSGGTKVTAGTLIAADPGALGTGGLNVSTGATARIQASLPKALTIASLTTSGTGKLDITDNSMVIRSMTAVQVRALIQGAFNAGHWNGATGLDSSTAAANASGTTAIGYGSNGILNKTAFKGVSPLSATDVLVKYTYYGDADLSGNTTLDDFTLFLGGYQNGGSTWAQGDFDYSGGVTLDDFTLFLKGYQQQGAQLSEIESMINSFPMSDAERAAMLAAVQAVPEPTGLALFGLAVTGLLARRRR